MGGKRSIIKPARRQFSQHRLAVHSVDVLIEATRKFEKDLDRLSEAARAVVIKKINDCAGRFPTQKADGYRELQSPLIPSDLNGYESSLYTLKVSRELRAILTVDEDPIFGQVVFTLFRVVRHDDLNQASKSVAASLYQELLHPRREPVQTL